MKGLALSDDYNNMTDKLIDLLVGKDFYFNFETGKFRWGPLSCSVAVDYILRWILCAPTRTHKTKLQENINFISSVIMRVETKTIQRNLKEELNKFWETENVGNGETKSVSQKICKLLPFKLHISFYLIIAVSLI